MAYIRLDRYLSEAGVGSRSEVKKLVAWGRVTVDGKVCRDPSAKISEDAAVTVDGVSEVRSEFRTIAMNKPAGYLSATEDRSLPTVSDLLEGRWAKFDLKPAGRLDRDTVGLLIMTNNGALNHGIISPSRNVPKIYEAEIDALLPGDAAARFAEGVTLDDGYVCLPAELISYDPEKNVARLKVFEGKYHQVKRMFASLGANVTALKRLSVGPVVLGDLAPGEFREITGDELSALMKCAGL